MNPISQLPPLDDEDLGYLLRSAEVIFTDGKEWWIAYYEKPDDFDGRWKQKGRDGYDITARLIGWTNLPKLA
jgi:hypothetical protein